MYFTLTALQPNDQIQQLKGLFIPTQMFGMTNRFDAIAWDLSIETNV